MVCSDLLFVDFIPAREAADDGIPSASDPRLLSRARARNIWIWPLHYCRGPAELETLEYLDMS